MTNNSDIVLSLSIIWNIIEHAAVPSERKLPMKSTHTCTCSFWSFEFPYQIAGAYISDIPLTHWHAGFCMDWAGLCYRSSSYTAAHSCLCCQSGGVVTQYSPHLSQNNQCSDGGTYLETSITWLNVVEWECRVEDTSITKLIHPTEKKQNSNKIICLLC